MKTLKELTGEYVDTKVNVKKSMDSRFLVLQDENYFYLGDKKHNTLNRFDPVSIIPDRQIELDENGNWVKETVLMFPCLGFHSELVEKIKEALKGL